MPRWIIAASVVLLVAARAAVFLIRPESYFDADQAIVGLMAKHLSELRAFPVFFYGQTYMLAVEAWLAAPLFAVLGPSITVLKLPLLAMNLTVALLLMALLQRELALTRLRALLAVLPFALPSVGLSALLLDSNGGNVETFVYIVVLWAVRRRPWLCGLVAGVGFLNREFTIYGVAAMGLLDLADRTLLTRDGVLRWARILAAAAAVWLSIQGLNQFASASGPGTSVRNTMTASNNVVELLGRTCVSPSLAVVGAGRLLTIHWPAILGTAPHRLTEFSIESSLGQGLAGSSWLPAVMVVLAIAGIAAGARTRPARLPQPARPRHVAHYLILTGLFSVAGYVLGRCGEVNFYAARYELLSLLALVGITAWFLSVPAPPLLRAGWGAAFAGWMIVVGVPQARFGIEYATHPPVPAKHALIEALQTQHVRYGTADYWLAYYIDFVTRERMIFAADAPQRILLYNAIVARHAAEAVRLSRRPCDGGSLLIPGVYKCR